MFTALFEVLSNCHSLAGGVSVPFREEMRREAAQTEAEGDSHRNSAGQRSAAGEVPAPQDPAGTAPCGRVQ